MNIWQWWEIRLPILSNCSNTLIPKLRFFFTLKAVIFDNTYVGTVLVWYKWGPILWEVGHEINEIIISILVRKLYHNWKLIFYKL